MIDMTIMRDAKGPKKDERQTTKRALLVVMAGALGLGVAFIAVTLLLSSCSASVSSTIKTDGSARISIQAEVPAGLAAKFRKLADSGSNSAEIGPFFDIEAVRKAIADRPSLDIVELSRPSADSIRAVVFARSLEALAASPDIKSSGLLVFSRGPGWAECRFRLEQGKAKAIASFFPGIDPYLMDALSPPALEEDPVTVSEYETMLKSVLGEKTMPALESAALSLSISAPSEVIGSGGGELSGSTLAAQIPIIDALALERPIELWIRWKTQ